MKKNLFFAATLFAAMTMAFTACEKKNDGNTPDEPDTPAAINPSDYINTMWRTDSAFMGGERSAAPHAVIEVMKDNVVIINGDTTTYKFEDGKLITHAEYDEPSVWTIVAANKETAHLKMDMGDVYLSKLPEWDMDAQIMEYTDADFVGTWKLAYHTGFHYPSGGPGEDSYHDMGTNPGVETWKFEANGTATYHSTHTGETKTGTWTREYAQIRFVENPGTWGDEDEFVTVQPLTHNWMGLVRADSYNTWQWFFIRVE